MNINKPLPNSDERDAYTLFELIARFLGLIELFGDDTLRLAINWLKTEREHGLSHNDKGAAYVLDAAITAMTWQVESDLNGDPIDGDAVRRTPKAELEVLRISLARIAQVVGAENNSVPVLSSAFRDNYAELANLARTQDRGWNALAAAILNKLETQAKLAAYEARQKRAREEIEAKR